MDVALSLREARRKACLSQGELAVRAGINRTYLSQLENGKSSPTFEILERIARALGIQTFTLISGASVAKEPDPRYEAEPRYEYDPDEPIYPGLGEFLNDERTRLLMNPTEEEIEELKRIRFLGRLRPSKQFFIDALFDYRRNKQR